MIRMLAETGLDLDIQTHVRQVQAGMNDPDQLARQERGPIGAAGMQHDEELAGRQARDHIRRVDVLAQAARHLAQGFIPHVMAQGGIDLPNIAHFNDHQCKRLTGCRAQQRVDVIFRKRPVGQAGQRILVGHAAQSG